MRTNDLLKFERYQAEALIYKHCPIEAIQGMVCYNKDIEVQIQKQLDQQSHPIKLINRPNWYF